MEQSVQNINPVPQINPMEQPVQNINPVPQINPMEQPVQNIKPIPQVEVSSQPEQSNQNLANQENEIFTTNGSQPFDINSMFANNK